MSSRHPLRSVSLAALIVSLAAFGVACDSGSAPDSGGGLGATGGDADSGATGDAGPGGDAGQGGPGGNPGGGDPGGGNPGGGNPGGGDPGGGSPGGGNPGGGGGGNPGGAADGSSGPGSDSDAGGGEDAGPDATSVGPSDATPGDDTSGPGAGDTSDPADADVPAPDAAAGDVSTDPEPDADEPPAGCVTGQTRCNGDDVELCTAPPSGWSKLLSCPAETPCADGVCCTPACDPEAECGGDGCGGSCGECLTGFTCVAGACECVPDCTDNACGDDGCGTLCGVCGEGTVCVDDQCVCAPSCGATECGDDGCGGSCGTCIEGAECVDGACVGACVPGSTKCHDQTVEVCGAGGQAWTPIVTCPASQPCWNATCCTPQCGGAVCGDDGCGGSCGACIAGYACIDGGCECVPQCADKACGGDGCGGSCGACGDGLACIEGACLCPPQCDGLECGDDGCGGSCGSCSGDGECVEGLCVDPCAPGETTCSGDVVQVCGDGGLFGDLMDCGGFGQVCEDGACAEPPAPVACAPSDTPCTGANEGAAACALDLCAELGFEALTVSSPTSNSTTGTWAAIAHYGNLANDLAPFVGDSYLILGTGYEPSTSHQDILPGNQGVADPYTQDASQMYDAVEVALSLTAPPWATGFGLRSIFMSVEYEEWIGSDFNDRFYMVLDAPVTTSGQAKVINAGACSNPNAYWDFQDANGKWCYIAINTAFSEKCPSAPTNISGTGYECPADGSSTGWLYTQHPIQGGEAFTLTLHIHDTADSSYDSAALVDGFEWLTGPVSQGTTSIDAGAGAP